MNIIFAGTPEPAVPSLDALARSSHEILAVLTRPDAPVGRKRVLTPSPVKRRALELGLPVIEADRLRGDVLGRLADLRPDAVPVVAYGAIAGPRALAIPRHGWLNLHFSLLPRWRGAAPVQRALMAGDEETGVSVFALDAGVDTGAVYAREATAIGPEETAGELLSRLAALGAGTLVAALDALAAGTAEATEQSGEASHADKVESADAALDLGQAADAVHRRFRGVTPAPGAWVAAPAGRFKIGGLRRAPAGAARLAPGELADSADGVLLGTGTEPLLLERIQPPGKAMMDARDFLRGRPDARLAGD